MRIISPKFHDYYDTVMSEGVDVTKIFMRETKEIEGHFPLPDWEKNINYRFHNQPSLYPKVHYATFGWKGDKSFTYFYILFAGKLYGGVLYTTLSGLKTYIWNLETLDKIIEDQKISKDFMAPSYFHKQSDYDNCKTILNIKGDEVLRDWSIENKISIAASGYFFDKEKKPFYITNPKLKDFDFQKVLDPFTAYQELSMWTSGVLGQNPEPDQVSDAVRIQQHGFDSWSFRKHKLDNTKARKK